MCGPVRKTGFSSFSPNFNFFFARKKSMIFLGGFLFVSPQRAAGYGDLSEMGGEVTHITRETGMSDDAMGD